MLPQKEKPPKMSGRFWLQSITYAVLPETDRTAFLAGQHTRRRENATLPALLGRRGKKPRDLRRFDRKETCGLGPFPKNDAKRFLFPSPVAVRLADAYAGRKSLPDLNLADRCAETVRGRCVGGSKWFWNQ